MALCPADSTSLSGQSTCTFHHEVLHGRVTPAPAPFAWEPRGRSQLHSSPQTAPAALWKPQPESSVGPFRIPVLPPRLEVISVHPWLSISSSASLRSFISGGYYPLCFYFQLGSGRWCEKFSYSAAILLLPSFILNVNILIYQKLYSLQNL